MEYESLVRHPSTSMAGVEFVVARMSFGRRMELMKRIRELAQRSEFSAAGEALQDKMDAAVAAAEIDRLYVEWGLAEIKGLVLDGEPATAQALVTAGPEELFREALEAVKRECLLNEAERKN